MTAEQEKVFTDMWTSIWPALTIFLTLASGTYFLVIEPIQRKAVEIDRRIDALDARLTKVEQEQWKRTGTIARFEELKSAYVVDLKELRDLITRLTEKMIELHLHNEPRQQKSK